MTAPLAFNEHAAQLKIKAAPKPVSKLNRKVLVAGAGLGALALFAAASVALRPPRAAAPGGSQEVYNTRQLAKPEALMALAPTYGGVEAGVRSVPQLGVPRNGDFGAMMLDAEQRRGIPPDAVTQYEDDFRPDPADDAARARLMQDADLAADAARAPVFFRLESELPPGPAARGSAGAAGGAPALAPELLALASAGAGARLGAAPDANLQDRKRAFASEAAGSDTYNPHRIEDPVSPWQVMAGTLIPASLITGINSDLPGTVIAQVTEPVYDTVTGTQTLIPQGARLLGRYQSEISSGQDRALVLWDRILFPDGASITISAPGADAAGYAGLGDTVDNHWDRVFASAGLATLLGIGAELGASGDDDDIERALRRGAGETVNAAGQRIVERGLAVQPTIRIRPGAPVRVIVTRDLILRPY